MINKNYFLKSFNISNVSQRKIVNSLIYFWQDNEFSKKFPNHIDESNSEVLGTAIIFVIYLLKNEVEGFHQTENYETLFRILKNAIINNAEITFFGILCPSYKKGIGAYGFADHPGNTTNRAFNNLITMNNNATKLGIKSTMIMFYSDISLENIGKFDENDWKMLKNNIKLDSDIALKHNVKYTTLTNFSPILKKEVGFAGKIVDTTELPISQKALERAMWRDRQFYPRMFGWSIKKAEERSLCHAHSYYWQGKTIRNKFKNPIMVYSAYDYEKGALYNGVNNDLPPYVVYPIKASDNPPYATLNDLGIKNLLKKN